MFTVCQEYNPMLNSHMMKNTEFGAVVYLAQSEYGKNSGITKNNTNTAYLTGGGSNTSYISNTGESTSGNVYGIYDIGGGAGEDLAAYLEGGVNSSITSIYNAPSYMKDVYTGYDASKYGDAIYETSSSYAGNTSWYGGQSNIINYAGIVMVRASNYDTDGLSNMFEFGRFSGAVHFHHTFRPVLIVQ